MQLTCGFGDEANVPALTAGVHRGGQNGDRNPGHPHPSEAVVERRLAQTVVVRTLTTRHPVVPRRVGHPGPIPVGHVLVGRVHEKHGTDLAGPVDRVHARVQPTEPVTDQQVADMVAFMKLLTGKLPMEYIKEPALPGMS